MSREFDLAVPDSWNRLALIRSLAQQLAHDCRTLADCAAGLAQLARLSPAEAEALADLVSSAHVLRGRARQHLPAITGATTREGDLAKELARRGGL